MVYHTYCEKMSTFEACAGHLGAALRHTKDVGSAEETPSFRGRILHQLGLLKHQATEHYHHPNYNDLVVLTEAALALFNIPVGQPYEAQLAFLNMKIEKFRKTCEVFDKILSI